MVVGMGVSPGTKVGVTVVGTAVGGSVYVGSGV